MAFYNFEKDLAVADGTEKEVAGLLEKHHKAKILDFEDTNKYDILACIKNKNYTFEVKEDFIGAITGNVGLEFECRGKPSGIQVSKAHFYIYKLHIGNNKVIFVLHEIGTIKDKITNKKYFRIVNGGDEGSNSMNYLFRRNVFLKDGYIMKQ